MVTNNLYQKVIEIINNFGLFKEDKSYTVVVGLSGGPDSMYLLYILSKMSEKIDIQIIPVHINHLLRESSTKEAYQLKNYVFKTYGLETLVFSSDIKRLSKLWKKGIEESGRIVRRKILEYVLNKYKADYIATGHNLDDQVETILFRIFRGTGLKGIIAMKIKDENYIRPLLFIEKSEILRDVEEKGIFYIKDPSNTKLDFTRNVIRHKIIPEIQNVNIKAKKNIFQLSMEADEIYNYILSEREKIFEKYFLFSGEGFHVFNANLLCENRYIVSETIRALYKKIANTELFIERKHVENFIKYASQKGSYSCFFPKKIYISKSCDFIIISKRKELFNGFSYKIIETCKVELPENLGFVHIQIIGDLKNEFYLRTFLPGDRYRGKKLKEVFLERRIPQQFRKAIPLVAKGSNIEHNFLFDGEKTCLKNETCKIILNFEPSYLYCKIKDFLV